jgi:pimeloyl-ACP methyl ester carboxylesterase
MQTETGYLTIAGARLYYEMAGAGQPFVMIHAGVADSRQWNNEFASFAGQFRVVRYDMRGFGKSEPAPGEYSNMGDLTTLLDHLQIQEPLVLMGCSMGGRLAIDFALAHPSSVKALVIVDSGPSGLELDVPSSPKFKEVEQADQSGDIDRVAELEIQIWFDGEGRTSQQVDQDMRRLAYEMNHTALEHDARQLGKSLPDTQTPAAGRLQELEIPALVIVGAHDTPYSLAAADYMVEKMPLARKVIIEDAAHLPNMDQPVAFQSVVRTFLAGLAE